MTVPLLRPQVRPVAVVPGPAAAAVALGIGVVLWRTLQDLNRWGFEYDLWWESQNQDSLYRRPNYRQMTSAQLSQAHRMLEYLGQDYYREPLTGTMIERRFLQRETLRRAGGGGFIFIPPPGFRLPESGGQGVTVAAAALALAGRLWDGATWLGRQLGGLAAQVWGLFNRPPGLVQAPDWNVANTTSVLYASPVSIGFDYYWERALCSSFNKPFNDCSGWNGALDTGTGSGGAQNVIKATFKTSGSVSNVIYGPAVLDVGDCVTWVEFEISDGSTVRHYMTNAPSSGPIPSGQWWRVDGSTMAYPTSWRVNGAEADPPLVPGGVPLPDGARLVTIEPGAEPQPQPLAPEPLPAYVPQLPPGAEPTTQPAPAPGQGLVPFVVITVPRAPAVPKTPTVPEAVPLPSNGTRPAPRRVPAPTTSPDVFIPWPGAKPVDTKPLAPPPTMEGIAKITGAIEGKVDQIGDMLQPKVPEFDWGDVLGGIARLVEWLSSIEGEGGYEISSPCETGPGSADDPLVASWPASTGPDARILKRLDAIAELLQHHKTLKQPSCKNPPPVGEWVTVNFEEL